VTLHGPEGKENHHHGLYGEICKTSTPGSNPGGASNFPRNQRLTDRRDVFSRLTVPKLCPCGSESAGKLSVVASGFSRTVGCIAFNFFAASTVAFADDVVAFEH
jgi:hypothetical protein